MNILDLVVGKPIKTSDERAEQIGPTQGIPIFGLDALSSAAYGPEAALSLLIPLGLLGVRYIVPKFGVNFTVILQIWPKIEHSSTSCLQQLMNFGKRSLIPPAVLAYERDGGFSLPSLGSRVS